MFFFWTLLYELYFFYYFFSTFSSKKNHHLKYEKRCLSARAKRSAAQAELHPRPARRMSPGGHSGNGNVHGGSGDGAVAETTKKQQSPVLAIEHCDELSKSPPPVVEKDHETTRFEEKQKEPGTSSSRHSLSDRRHLDETFRAGRKERRVRGSNPSRVYGLDESASQRPSALGNGRVYLGFGLGRGLNALRILRPQHTSPTEFTGNTSASAQSGRCIR